MKESLSNSFLFQHMWLIEVVFLVAGFYLLNRLLIRIIRKAQERSMEKKSEKVELLHTVLFPGRVLLGILLVASCVQIIMQRFPAFNVFSFVIPLRNIGIVCCLSWWLFRWKAWLFKVFSTRLSKSTFPIDSSLLEMSGKVLNVLIFCVAFLVVMQIFGLDIVPFVTFGGIGTAAIAFAAQGHIANYVNGFVLYATRSFSVGDLIEIPEKDIIGNVEQIGWCLTSIRTLHKKPVFIPNSVFSSTYIINISRMKHRCFHDTISIRYDDISRLPAVLEEVQNLFKNHPKVDQTLPIFVVFKEFGSYSLDIETRAYVTTPLYQDFMEIKQKILIEIHRIIVSHSAKICYPTSLLKAEGIFPTN